MKRLAALNIFLLFAAISLCENNKNGIVVFDDWIEIQSVGCQIIFISNTNECTICACDGNGTIHCKTSHGCNNTGYQLLQKPHLLQKRRCHNRHHGGIPFGRAGYPYGTGQYIEDIPMDFHHARYPCSSGAPPIRQGCNICNCSFGYYYCSIRDCKNYV